MASIFLKSIIISFGFLGVNEPTGQRVNKLTVGVWLVASLYLIVQQASKSRKNLLTCWLVDLLTFFGSVEKCRGRDWNKKHKKQPFGDASASHLSLVLWHVWFQAEAWISHTTPLTPPSYEVGGIAKRIKTARLRRKTNLQKSDYPKTRIKRDPNALCVLEYDNLYLYQIINIQCIILIIGGREISCPYPNVGYRFEKFDAVFYQEIIISPGVFRRETASGFYPWGNVGSPRKRVAEGLCGWRHGNSFPMTQSAQSHSQMRSVPHCSKAVFLCFCFWFHSQFGNIA